MDYSTFITNVARTLSQKGWSDLEGYSQRFDLVVTRQDTTAIVMTRRVIAFLKGDGLSKSEIQEAVSEAHGLMSRKAMPPLFPATSVLVFVFEKPHDVDWILDKARKRSLFKSNFTVSWVVDLSERALRKHTGLPIIGSGESEIKEALSAVMT